MKDHETLLRDRLKEKLLGENLALREELFKRLPLREKIYAYGFAITCVGGILFTLWLVGYIIYVLVTKRT